jgi:hypothetical protein
MVENLEQAPSGQSSAPGIKTVTIRIDDTAIAEVPLPTCLSRRLAKMFLIDQAARAIKGKGFDAVLAQMGFQ